MIVKKILWPQLIPPHELVHGIHGRQIQFRIGTYQKTGEETESAFASFASQRTTIYLDLDEAESLAKELQRLVGIRRKLLRRKGQVNGSGGNTG